MNDETLLASYVAGDRSAFTTLVGRHRDRLVQYVTRQLRGDSATAEDVVQGVWIKITEHAHQFNPGAAFRPWLYGMVWRLVLDARRLKRRTEKKFVPYRE